METSTSDIPISCLEDNHTKEGAAYKQTREDHHGRKLFFLCEDDKEATFGLI